MDFTFTPHALEVMQERDIPLQVVLTVLGNPEEITPEEKGRSAYQSIVEVNGKPYILRVIVESDTKVITIYRTSKVKKYRSEDE